MKRYEDYNVNPSTFLNVTTPEVAYILGLLWADGNIYKTKIAIECVEEDLKTLKHIFDKTGKWGSYIRHRNIKWKPILNIWTTNKVIVEFLNKHNYSSKSIDSTSILSIIPENLQHYWFRGLSDGDGTFSYTEHINKKPNYRFSISGPFEQNWEYLEKMLKSLKIDYSIYQHSKISKTNRLNRASSLHIFRHTDIIKLGNYLYKDYEKDNIGLMRKYYKFTLIKGLTIKNNF